MKTIVALSMMVGTSPAVHACSVCFGDPQSPQTAGMNAAIGTLLGITVVVLAGISSFAVAIYRRSAMLSSEDRHD